MLLDTHIILWAAIEPRKLPAKASRILRDANNELYFSAANLWEIAIKSGKGLANFKVDSRVLYRSLLANGYAELPVTGHHALAVEHLPDHHADPFDRILLAQAMVEGIYLLTVDTRIELYAGPVIKV